MADTSSETTRPNGPDQNRQALERVLGNLSELEPELKAAAILGPGRQVLASVSVEPGSQRAWSVAAAELLDALEAVREREVDSAHLATDAAEIFVVRQGDLALVAVTDRFVLASLTSFDMRMALRDAASGAKNA